MITVNSSFSYQNQKSLTIRKLLIPLKTCNLKYFVLKMIVHNKVYIVNLTIKILVLKIKEI